MTWILTVQNRTRSWLRRSLFNPPMRWAKIRGEKLGWWANHPSSPNCWGNDVIAHLFSPQSVGENCGLTLANKMAHTKSKLYDRLSGKHLIQIFIHENLLHVYVLNITKLSFTTVKLHHVIDIINHNALEKSQILTTQSLSVLNLHKHGLQTRTSEDESYERYECWQESYFVMITLLVNDYTDLNSF